MEIYIAVKRFKDLEDNNRPYNVGDLFPRKGFEVSKKRIKSLETTNNRRNEVMIEKLDLVKLKKDKLLKIAKKLDVEVDNKDTKTEIIERIEAL